MSSPADELSEYERARLANIAENRKILVSLGLEDEWRLTSKRTPTSTESSQKRSKEPPPLTEEQKAALARCADWLPRFEVWLRGEVSVDNANKTMDRVKELVSGKGVYLRGFGVAFSGTAVSIFDDLVSLKAFAQAKFGPKGNNRDAGGWHLNHPLGKLVKFQQVLLRSGGLGGSSSASSGASDGESGTEASGPSCESASATWAASAPASWLVEGAAVEVEMREEGLYESRYSATVLELHDGGKTARVRYDHLLESAADESTAAGSAGSSAPASAPASAQASAQASAPENTPTNAEGGRASAQADGEVAMQQLVEDVEVSALRPPPPRCIGWATRLKVGSACEVWHQDGWWEVRVFAKRLRKGSNGRQSTVYDIFSESYAEIDFPVAASRLRPKLVLVNHSDWLAMAPLGFKVPLGEAEHKVGEEEEEVSEEEAERERRAEEAARAAKQDAKAEREARRAAEVAAKAEAAAAKAAAREAAKSAKERAKEEATKAREQAKEAAKEAKAAEQAAAKEAKAAERAAAKEAKAAERAAGRAAAKEARTACKHLGKRSATARDDSDDAGAVMPREQSLRWYIHRAIVAGKTEREAIVAHIGKASGARFSRCDLVTMLGKEKSKTRVPLWQQDGSCYELTDEAKALLPARHTRKGATPHATSKRQRTCV